MADQCFICGTLVKNNTQTDKTSSKSKLVSIHQSLENSGTIISDMLSRILNETVLRDESICKMCFKLLNEIDTHLRQAQEKTDALTAKFLDKDEMTTRVRGDSPRPNEGKADPSFKSERRKWRKAEAESRERPVVRENGVARDAPLIDDNIREEKKRLISQIWRHGSVKVSQEDPGDEIRNKRAGTLAGRTPSPPKSTGTTGSVDIGEATRGQGTTGEDRENERVVSDAPVAPQSVARDEVLVEPANGLPDQSVKKKPKFFKHRQIVRQSLATQQNDVVKQPSILPKDEKPKISNSVMKAQMKASEKTNFYCSECDQYFKRRFNLDTHIIRKHDETRRRQFSCDHCEKAFVTKSDLRQHMHVHMDKKFGCEFCPRQFSNRDSAIFHRKMHLKEYTHFCSYCNKGFYKAGCLNRHQRIHTGERPFPCKKCKRRFTQSATLKSHIAKCVGVSHMTPSKVIKVKKALNGDIVESPQVPKSIVVYKI